MPDNTFSREKPERDRAMRVFEERNRAFRVLYEAVVAVEQAPDAEAFGIFCAALRALADARWVALLSYDVTSRSLRIEAMDAADGAEAPVVGAIGASARVPDDVVDLLRGDGIVQCPTDRACPVLEFCSSAGLLAASDGSGMRFLLRHVHGDSPVAIALLHLAPGGELKLRDVVETYLSTAGLIIQRMKAADALRDLNETLEQRVVERTARLRRSEERFRGLVESSSDWIWEVDAEGVYTYASPQVESMLGYSPEEIVGRTPFDLMPSKEAELVSRTFREHVADRKPLAALPNTCLHKDGRAAILETSGVPFFDEEGTLRGYRGVDRDITERRALELQLLQAQKMESIGRLAGGVAHDFNNLLTGILGWTELCRGKTAQGDVIREWLDEIDVGVKRSADIVRKLLTFARKQAVSPRVLDLNEVTGGMLKLLRRLIGEDIELAWLPGDDLWRVKIDPSQIDQILANLVVNARDAIDGVGHIAIKTRNEKLSAAGVGGAIVEPGEYVVLTVSDTGAGIDAEAMEHIFEPFFTTKGASRGSGLGLATVYGIAKQNGGGIVVHNAPGRGAAFDVYLPRCLEVADAVQSQDDAEAVPGGSETVLLVEDDTPLRVTFVAFLKQAGYHVLAAGTPSTALALAQNATDAPCLLIADVILPEMNGADLARELKKSCLSIKCMYMSGYAAEIIEERGILSKGARFLQKPFSREVLLTTVRDVLDSDADNC